MIVRLMYFKESGKYYSSGQYETDHTEAWKVYEQVADMLVRGQLPDLAEGARFDVLVEGDDLVPHLIRQHHVDDWEIVARDSDGDPLVRRFAVPGGWLYMTVMSNSWSSPAFVPEPSVRPVP